MVKKSLVNWSRFSTSEIDFAKPLSAIGKYATKEKKV